MAKIKKLLNISKKLGACLNTKVFCYRIKKDIEPFTSHYLIINTLNRCTKHVHVYFDSTANFPQLS